MDEMIKSVIIAVIAKMVGADIEHVSLGYGHKVLEALAPEYKFGGLKRYMSGYTSSTGERPWLPDASVALVFGHGTTVWWWCDEGGNNVVRVEYDVDEFEVERYGSTPRANVEVEMTQEEFISRIMTTATEMGIDVVWEDYI